MTGDRAQVSPPIVPYLATLALVLSLLLMLLNWVIALL